MSQPSAMDTVFYLLVLIFPLSALLAQRLPLGSTVKMIAAWVAIFAMLLIVVGQKERFRPLWQGAVATLTGDEQIVTGGTVRIPMSGDGHFWATVRINGVACRMLIDSGATSTALSEATAKAVGVAIDGNAPAVMLETANGRVIAAHASVAVFQLGDITARGLPVVVAREFGDADMIGMNFLSRLKGWRVERRVLILKAAAE